jgi:predicted membrane protein
MKQAANAYINSIKPNKKGILTLLAFVVFLPVATALLFETNNSVAPFSLLIIFLGGLLMLAMLTLCYHIVYFMLKHIFVTFVLKNMSHKK